MEDLRSDVQVIKKEVSLLRSDMSKVLNIMLESDRSVVSRVSINEVKIKEIEKNQWHAKTALGSAILGFLINLGLHLFRDVK